MAKYLQVVEMNYNLEDILGLQDTIIVNAIREAATLYAYYLTKAKITTQGISKVILNGGIDSKEITVMGDTVLIYSHPYQYLKELDINSTPKDIQQVFIQEVTSALLEVGKEHEWDLEAILELQKTVDSKEYKFEGVWVKPKLNEEKTKAVGIAWKTNDKLEIGFVMKAKKSAEETEYPIIRINIGLGLFESILGKLIWENNHIVRFYHTNKREYWELNTEQRQVTFHYPRAESGDAHGQYDLAKMYLEGDLVEIDESKAIEWLQKSANQGFGRAKKLLEELA